MDRAAQARVFEAALRVLGESGFDGIAVADVVARADVSQLAFEAEFGDIDKCLFAAYEDLTERLAQRAAECCTADDSWPSRVGAGLDVLLGELATQPELATVLTRSFPAIRPLAHLRYMEFLESFAPLLREGRDFSDLSGELPGEIEMLAIGAAEALVFEAIEAGRAAELPALAPTIHFALLVPFMGPARALEAAPGANGQPV
jgi:AcrR family transcriptional regulator